MPAFNLRIRGRLYGGFGVLVLLGLAMACIGVWQLWEISVRVERMGQQSQNAIRVGTITGDLQAIRRGLLRYILDHDEASFAESEKRLSDIAEPIEVNLKNTVSEERRLAYQELNKDIAELKLKRGALGEAVDKFVGARRALFVEGDTMTVDMTKFADAAHGTALELEASALDANVLRLRLANWRLLATRDGKGVDIFNANLKKTREQLSAIGETNRSADHVLSASGNVSGAAALLAEEVREFFVKLRSGAMDRRKEEGSNYGAPSGAPRAEPANGTPPDAAHRAIARIRACSAGTACEMT